MKKRMVMSFIVLFLLISSNPFSFAASRPDIVKFESTVTSISVDDAESGLLTTTLSWHVIGMTSNHRLTLHVYKLDNWESVFPPTAVPFESNGSVPVTISHPSTFSPPTFLLSVVNETNQVITQRTLSIPFDTPVDPPRIETFDMAETQVDSADLTAGIARVLLSWKVVDRYPGSNLVFEQVFADGTAQSVELPRDISWVPSTGQGQVAPVFRQDSTDIVLRLRVIDVITQAVYTEQQLTLTVDESALTGSSQTTVSSSAESTTCVPISSWPTYSVQAGDNLFRIAQAAETTTAQLVTANCLPNTTIVVGQKLYVPKPIVSVPSGPTPDPEASPVTITPETTDDDTLGDGDGGGDAIDAEATDCPPGDETCDSGDIEDPTPEPTDCPPGDETCDSGDIEG